MSGISGLALLSCFLMLVWRMFRLLNSYQILVAEFSFPTNLQQQFLAEEVSYAVFCASCDFLKNLF